jgi:hypothetical protein
MDLEYLNTPVRAFPTGHGRLNKLHPNSDGIIDMHPGPRIRPIARIKRRTDLLNLVQKRRNIRTLIPSWTASLTINIRRTHNSSLQHITVPSRSLLDDLVDIAMQLAVVPGCDFINVVDIRPNFGVQVAEVGILAPVCDDTCAAEMDEEGWGGLGAAAQETGNQGFDGGLVVGVAVVWFSLVLPKYEE